jgi:hypothetical protein
MRRPTVWTRRSSPALVFLFVLRCWRERDHAGVALALRSRFHSGEEPARFAVDDCKEVLRPRAAPLVRIGVASARRSPERDRIWDVRDMPRRPRKLSGPRELVQGATLGLPLRGLSFPGSEPCDIAPPVQGVRSPDPNGRGAPDGMSASAEPQPGGAAPSHAVLTIGARKPPSGRPRARERILVAMLGLALAAVLAHAARRATALDTQSSRRSR